MPNLNPTELLFEAFHTLFAGLWVDYSLLLVSMTALLFIPLGLRLLSSVIRDVSTVTPEDYEDEIEGFFEARNKNKGSWKYDYYNHKYQSSLKNYEDRF